MRGWKFWEKDKHTEPTAVDRRQESAQIAPRARGFHAPPPREDKAIQPRDPQDAEKIARLNKRRETVLFDVEQAEAASQPDNIWDQRVAVIDDALQTVKTDRSVMSEVRAQPGTPLPETPISDLNIRADTPSRVSFSIGGEPFVYEEDIDWAERGTQLVRPDLIFRSGNIQQLIPRDLAVDRNAVLVNHLSSSLFVFATDLRDRALAESTLPDRPKLSDLASPSEECGGWLDWHGMSAECEQREWKLSELSAEEERLRRERDQIEEERARMADRLPIALRRLAEVDAEIAKLGE